VKVRSTKARLWWRGALVMASVMIVATILLVSLAAPAAACETPVTLTGTVTGDAGSALRGVHVKVLSGDSVVAGAVTNWAGEYKVCVVPGTYDLKFEARTYASTTSTAVVVPETGAATANAALTRLPVLTGTVTNGTRPLKEVMVKVMSGDKIVAKAMTGRAGVYKVYVAEGTYDVVFCPGGYEPLTNKTVAVVAPSTTLDAVLGHKPVLSGLVTGEAGAIVRCAQVKVMSGDKVVARTVTDRKGQYRVVVPTGTYDIKVYAKTYEVFGATGVAVAAPSTTFNVSLTRMPVLTGKVTGAEGVALRNTIVKIKNGTTLVAFAKTNRNGVYTVYVAAGTYDVTFWHWGYAPLTDTGVVTVAPSTTLDAALTPAA
jgi:hypothetical protein